MKYRINNAGPKNQVAYKNAPEKPRDALNVPPIIAPNNSPKLPMLVKNEY